MAKGVLTVTAVQGQEGVGGYQTTANMGPLVTSKPEALSLMKEAPGKWAKC